MKTGYDKFFKQAQKIAAEGHTPVQKTANRRVQSQDAKVLVEELRKRVRPKMQAKKTKRNFPWKLAGISFMGLIIAGVGLLKAEEIENFAKRVEISFLGSAHAEETKPAPQTDKAQKPPETAAPAAKKELSEEDLNHFTKLNDRKRELDAREEELGRLEKDFHAKKAEL
jgi:hypothetical protein